MKSGLYNTDALGKECPSGFVKITEGSTAVLFPPAMTAANKTASAQPPQHHDGAENNDQAVFYNPAQVVNRDLSICAIELFSRRRLEEPRRRGGTREGITILEALSATGLRAIRYYKEITNVRYIIANDLDPDAVDCIRRNCEFNRVPTTAPTLRANFSESAIQLYPIIEEDVEVVEGSESSSQKKTKRNISGGGVLEGGAVIPNLDDAIDLMHRLAANPNVHDGKRLCVLEEQEEDDDACANEDASTPCRVRGLLQQELMDVVDLDPYGTASPFLDGAMACIKEGGLMLVTSTDSAILCGNYPDTCHAKYNSIPYKGSHCHEMAVRILLACIERAANKHKKFIVPIISLHIDFYVRCFFRVYTQAAEVKLSPCKLGYQLQCTHCPAFWVRPMATAKQPRGRAAAAAAAAAGGGNRKRGRSNSQCNTSDVEGKSHRDGDDIATTAGSSNSSSGKSAFPHGQESFPAPPSRQNDPKLSPLTLRQQSVAPVAPVLSEVTSSSATVLTDGACPVCGTNTVTVSGPLYCAATQSTEYLPQLLAIIEERHAEGKVTATARISGLVRAAMEELTDCPLFYELPDIASYVRVRCPPTPFFVGALARMGYRYSQVHCSASGLKTDCPPDVLMSVMLQWKAVQDAQDASIAASSKISNEGSVVAGQKRESEDEATNHQKKKKNAGETIAVMLRVGPLKDADFTYDKKFDFRRQATGVAKFIPNAPGWGPKRRHQGTLHVEEEEGAADAEQHRQQ